MPGAILHVSGAERTTDGKLNIAVEQDQTREVRMSVQVGSAMAPLSPANVEIKATDIATGRTATARDHFVPPNL